MLTDFIEALTKWKRALDLSNNQIAILAGIHERSMRNFDTGRHWNPTLETLMKLESVLPKGWRK